MDIDYLADVAARLLNGASSNSSNLCTVLKCSPQANAFFQLNKEKTLCIGYDSKQQEYKVDSKVQNLLERCAGRAVVLGKSEDNEVILTTIKNSVQQSLYQALHNLYEPQISKGNAQVEYLLESLESALSEFSASPLVLLKNEIKVWESSNSAQASGVLNALDSVYDICKQLSTDEYVPAFVQEAQVTVQELHTHLSLLQRCYEAAQKPTKDVVWSVARAILSASLRNMQPLNLWQGPFQQVQEALFLSLALLKSFCGPAYAYPDQAPKFALAKLAARLDEILAIRQLHKYLLSELGEQQARELGISEQSVYADFQACNPFDCLWEGKTNSGAQSWSLAVANFDRKIQLAESQLVSQLVTQYRAWRPYPQQHRLELLRNELLFSRPSCREILGVELDYALKEAVALQQQVSESLIKLENSSEKVSFVERLVRSSQLLAQIKPLEKLVELGQKLSYGGVDSLDSCLVTLRKRFEEQRQAWLVKWIAWAQKSLSNWKDPSGKKLLPEPTLEMDAETCLLTVNSSDQIQKFVAEYKQLNLCQLQIPPKHASQLQQLHKEAQRVFRSAIHLKQLAEDYNAVRNDTASYHAPLLEKKAHSLTAAMQKFMAQQSANDAFSADSLQVLLAAANECARLKNKLHEAHAYLLEQMNVASSSAEGLSRIAQLRAGVWEEQVARLESDSGVGYATEWRLALDKALVESLQAHLSKTLGAADLPWLPAAQPAELVGSSEQGSWVVSLHDRQLRDLAGLTKEVYRALRRTLAAYLNFPTFSRDSVSASREIFNFPEFQALYSKNLVKIERLVSEVVQKTKDFLTYETLGVSSGANLTNFDAERDWIDIIRQTCKSFSDFQDQFTLCQFHRELLAQRPNVIETRLLSISTKLAKASVGSSLEQVYFSLITSIEQQLTDNFNQISAQCDAIDANLELLSEKGSATMAVTRKLQIARELSDQLQVCQSLKANTGEWNKLLSSNGASTLLRQQLEDRIYASESKATSRLQQLESLRTGGSKLVKEAWSLVIEDVEKLQRLIASNGPLTETTQAFSALEERAAIAVEDAKLYPNLKLDRMELLDSLRSYFASIAAVTRVSQNFDAALEGYVALPWLVLKQGRNTWVEMLATFSSQRHELASYLEGSEVGKDSPGSRMLSKLNETLDALELLRDYVGNDCWAEEHYATLYGILGISDGSQSSVLKIPLVQLTLGHLLGERSKLLQNKERILELNSLANSQATLRQVLNEVKGWVSSSLVPMMEYKDTRGNVVPLLLKFTDVLHEVAEQVQLLGSMKDLPRFDDFKDQASQLERQLLALEGALQFLQPIQRKWVYLEPIFGSGTALIPAETQRFVKVDGVLKKIWGAMYGRFKSGNSTIFNQVLKPLSNVTDYDSGIGSSDADPVEAILQMLERCEKALKLFLEEKRSQFPRFYFISDEDLLEIWGQSGNPNVIQAHLKKLFAGVAKVIFKDSNIVAMQSVDGEVVNLDSPLSVQGVDIHVWLQRFTVGMQETLFTLLKSAYTQTIKLAHSQPAEFVVCLLNGFPGQIASLLHSIVFTEQVETLGVLSDSPGKSVREGLDSLVKNLDLELQALTEKAFGKQLELQRKALVMDVIHFKDVALQLSKVYDDHRADLGFQWKKQLRYYLNPQKKVNTAVKVCMFDAEFDYSFEYQGNAQGRLAHTPLTDKCYLVLTQAMKRGFGGNPFGPAGTGKTESVKALGLALGRQVLVFNCDEGLDYQSMTRCFSGIIQCGAWGCFDEFNRLDESVLSTISSQIQAIQVSVQAGRAKVSLDGSVAVPLHPNTSIFVTLNPAGKNYGGRSKLPDNLKQLLRSVAMSAPNLRIIIETELASQNFKFAKILSEKLLLCFQLCQQLCTKQRHYDWGLRAIKANLLAAGSCLMELGSKERTITEEEGILIRTLRSGTLSKLTRADSDTFEALLQDIFLPESFKLGGQNASDSSNTILDTVYAEFKLTRNAEQDVKIEQILDGLEQRMGLVLLGEAGTGKTSAWRMARRKFELDTKQTVHVFELDPKSMPRTQLLGEMDYDTREWSDGVLTKISRKAAELASETTHVWVVLDGDVDPEWIESLNSVLDDNRLLTIPNGERIQFNGNRVHFLFETNHLHFASPATVSRMAMIYFYKAFNPWRLLSPALKLPCDKIVSCFENEDRLVLAMLYNSLHSSLCSVERPSWADLLVPLTSSVPFSQRAAAVRNLTALDYPLKFGGTMEIFSERLNNGLPDKILGTKGLLDCVARLEYFVKRRAMCLAVLAGGSGTGKSTALKVLKRQLHPAQLEELHLHSKTRSASILQWLRAHGTFHFSQKGRCWSPKNKHGVVLVLRNVERLPADKYMSVELLSFLRQWYEHGGFYDNERGNREFVRVDFQSLSFILTTKDEPFLRNVAPRLAGKVSTVTIEAPSSSELEAILQLHLPEQLQDYAKCIVQLFDRCCKQFPHLFTPRHAVQWAQHLQSYALEDSAASLTAEAFRLFHDCLSNASDRSKVSGWIRSVLPPNQYEPALNVYTAAGQRGSTALQCVKRETYFEQLSVAEEEKNFVWTDSVLALASTVEKSMFLGERGHLLVAGNGTGRLHVSKAICRRLDRVFVCPLGGAINSVKSEMKRAFTEAGLNGNKTVAYLAEHVLISVPGVLEMVNDLILSNNIPDLFSREEWESLLSQVQNVQKVSGFDGTPTQFLQFRISQNLHVILSLSPRELMDSREGTSSSGVLNWISRYLHTTVVDVASTDRDLTKFVEKVAHLESSPEAFEKISQRIISTHRQQQSSGASNAHFLQFLEVCAKMYGEKQSKILQKREFLKGGLDKLKNAADSVMHLSMDAEEQQEKLAVKKREADAALEAITSSLSTAADQRQELKKISEELQSEQTEISKKKILVEQELASVEPLIQEAKSKVGDIRSESLSEIRSLRAPPPVIKDVLDGVLRLMGIYDTSWNGMKQFLAKRTVKEEILNFDARKIEKSSLKEVQKLLEAKPDSFDEASVRKASVAAAPLAAWVKANVQYANVLANIQPLEQSLKALQDSLAKSQVQVDMRQSELSAADEHVAKLRADFGKLSTETAALEAGLARTTETLSAASQLLEKLNDEGHRWSEQYNDLHLKLNSLYEHVVDAAACLVYPQRDARLLEANVSAVLATELDRISWRSSGLMGDKDSMATASRVLARWQYSSKGSLIIIDPNNFAVDWLIKQIPKLEVIAYQTDAHWLSRLELAVRFGKFVLVTNIDKKIPPLFTSLIKRLLIKQDATATGNGGGARSASVVFGDKLIEFNPSFKVLFATRSAQVEIDSSIASYIMPADFSVTHDGFSDQLLSKVLLHENPELESKKREALQNEENLVQALEQLQESLLQELVSSQGNILDNSVLIKSLDETKTKAGVVARNLSESRALQQELDSERLKYLPFAQLASRVYFSLCQLKKLNTMYQFSSDYYIAIFQRVIESGSGDESRIDSLVRALKQEVYWTSCRSIFRKDHYSWGCFLLCASGDVSKESLMRLLSITASTVSGRLKFDEHWIQSWSEMREYVSSVTEASWSTWLQSDVPETSFSSTLSHGGVGFLQLCLIKAWRADRFQVALERYVASHLGTNPDLMSSEKELQRLSDEFCSKVTLFVLAPGTPDLTAMLTSQSKLSKQNLTVVPMGQNQGTLAREKLREAATTGCWLFLQNLHLAVSWLPDLARELQAIALGSHSDFRLFMSTEPLSQFPSALALNCSLVALEGLPGLKNQMERIFSLYKDFPGVKEAFDDLDHGHALFGLAWFHAVLQERRNYLPQGWTVYYEFWQSDLKTGVDILLQSFSGKRIDWRAIKDMLFQAIYGGRIDNEQDCDKLLVLLDQTLSGSYPEDSPLAKFLPQSAGWEESLKQVQKLPSDFNPASLGLPQNIDRAVQQRLGETVSMQLRTLMSNEGQDYARDGLLQSQLSMELDSWKSIWNGDELATKANAIRSGSDPLDLFIDQELGLGSQLVELINSDFEACQRFVRGDGQDGGILLKELVSKLLTNQVPDSWTRLYDPMNDDISVSTFLQMVGTKVRILREIHDSGSKKLLKQGVSLQAFFNVATFLNVLRQMASRESKQSIDRVRFSNAWSNSSPLYKKLLLPILVSGLLVQGGKFNGEALEPVRASDLSYIGAPPCYFGWVIDDEPTAQGVSVPLYVNGTRGNALLKLGAPASSSLSSEKCSLYSTALFVSV